jgi:hypothetical protein
MGTHARTRTHIPTHVGARAPAAAPDEKPASKPTMELVRGAPCRRASATHDTRSRAAHEVPWNRTTRSRRPAGTLSVDETPVARRAAPGHWAFTRGSLGLLLLGLLGEEHRVDVGEHAAREQLVATFSLASSLFLPSSLSSPLFLHPLTCSSSHFLPLSLSLSLPPFFPFSPSLPLFLLSLSPPSQCSLSFLPLSSLPPWPRLNCHIHDTFLLSSSLLLSPLSVSPLPSSLSLSPRY